MYADGFAVPTQTFITQDVQYLAKNHEILFVCVIKNSNLSIPNVTVKHIVYKQPFWKKVLERLDLRLNYKEKNFSSQVQELIESFQPDVIHCQFGIEALKFIDNLEDTATPVAIQFRGYDASRMLRNHTYVKRLQEILNRKNYFSIFVADSLRQNLKKYQVNTENSMILHSGIDLDKFKIFDESTKKEEIFTFLQISSLKGKKGHVYTIKAFAKFLAIQEDKNYRLQLTGDGTEKEALEALVRELNIEKYVEFI